LRSYRTTGDMPGLSLRRLGKEIKKLEKQPRLRISLAEFAVIDPECPVLDAGALADDAAAGSIASVVEVHRFTTCTSMEISTTASGRAIWGVVRLIWVEA
jgi:hypothetical protein